MCLLLRIGIIDDRTAKVRIPCISTLYKCFDDSAREKLMSATSLKNYALKSRAPKNCTIVQVKYQHGALYTCCNGEWLS